MRKPVLQLFRNKCHEATDDYDHRQQSARPHHQSCPYFTYTAQYQGMVDTIVQLIRRSTSRVIASSRLTPSISERMASDMAEATWKPYEKHGQLTRESDLPDSVFAFPKQRKEPLTDAEHVRNAVARFDQVIDVSDAEHALAFANIEKAAKHYGVNLGETSWHDLGIHPQKNRKEAAAQGAVTRKRRVQG